jgi:hypothetical protein
MLKKAYIEITNICNLRCDFCPGTRREKRTMQAEEFALLAKKLRPHAAYFYLHVMGEPLLHPQLKEILAICAGVDAKACITTNGTLLESRGEVLLQAEKLHKVSVSLHSMEGNGVAELRNYLESVWAFAEKAATIPDELYEYIPLPGGNLASGSGSRRHWEYKFLVLESRKRLDAKTEGAVWRYCAASCVFSAMEMMRLWKRAGLSPREAFGDLRRYISDRRVKEALRAFPLSRRHPLAAAAVLFLRFLSR